MAKLTKLKDLKNNKCVISNIQNMQEEKHKRLLELGFIKGTRVEIIKRTKDTLLIGIRGYVIALDKDVAGCIFVWED